MDAEHDIIRNIHSTIYFYIILVLSWEVNSESYHNHQWMRIDLAWGFRGKAMGNLNPSEEVFQNIASDKAEIFWTQSFLT